MRNSKLFKPVVFVVFAVVLFMVARTITHEGKQKPYVESSLLIQKPAWEKKVKGKYNNTLIALSLEVSKELCSNRTWCGFEENSGTFKDIANTVAYAVELLQGNISSNLLFQDNGEHLMVNPQKQLSQKFDPKVPVRIIYLDGDVYTLPRNTHGFSKGWGVDPIDQGLVMFFASNSIQHQDYIHSGILDILLEITNTMIGNDRLDERQLEAMINIWTNNDSQKVESRDPILKILVKDE